MNDPEVEKERQTIVKKIFHENNIVKPQQTIALIKELSAAPTNEAKMKVAAKYLSFLRQDNYLKQRFEEVKSKTNFKDRTKSEQLRTQGNKEYGKREDKKALELYTKSIAYAPQNSSELHLAYANRSAVLRSMKKCRECLVDVERALTLGYPRDKSFKLLLREMQCHRDLGNIEEMNASCQKAEILLQSLTGLTEKEVAALKKQLDGEKKASPKEVCTETVIFPKEVPELSYRESSEIVGASSAVRIAYNKQQGRHLVANRDINIGDVLLIGENIVGSVMDQHKYDHCTHCHKPCYNLMPCHSCVWALFCSEECQLTAIQKYHSSECAAYSRYCHFKANLFFGNTNLVIHLLAVIGIDNLQPYLKYASTNKNQPTTNEDKRTKGFDSHGVFDSTKIDTIFNLISMVDRYSQDDLLGSSVLLLHIPRCFGMSMKHPDFFAVAGLCLQLQDTANLASITKTYKAMSKVPIASTYCFNPLNSLINHSCVGNLTSIHSGNYMVSFAKWPISKGSILTDSYFDLDVMHPKEVRQQILKKNFSFDCKCIACEKNWRVDDQCISNPVDEKMAFDLLKLGKDILLTCQKYEFTDLSHICEQLLRFQYEFLTKMWHNGEYINIRCEEMQAQLRFCRWMHGNRITRPVKKDDKSYQQRIEALVRMTDWISVSVRK